MKKISINSENELFDFLQIVAEESVKKSLRESSLSNNDKNVEQYKIQKKKDEKIFKSLREEEESLESEKPADNQDVTSNDAENKTDVDTDIEITPRKIIAKINNIRAGHSLKNSDVKENLIDYLERLDKNELLVMFYYLDGVAKILNQTIKGSEAMDPSEDPLNIDMTRSADSEKSSQDGPDKSRKPAKVGKSKDQEDTSPPIKVNESQSKEDIRRKIRILMSWNSWTYSYTKVY